jgi:predicted outer membrane protein
VSSAQALLTSWQSPVPTAGESDPGLPGAVSTADVSALRKLAGKAFDDRFLDLLIANQRGMSALVTTGASQLQSGDARQIAAHVNTVSAGFVDALLTVRGR